ncbi:Glycosidase, partial [Sarracenia purpurea var. burkii]
TGGNSGTEPYIVAHNQLLAHGAVVKLYRRKYQKLQKGEIGITLVSTWILPLTNRPRDIAARQRALDFMFGWFMDPITTGHYPQSMQRLVGSRLPKFSERQSKTLIGSFDFLGLNYYSSQYAGDAHYTNLLGLSYSTDSQVNLTYVKNGVAIGPAPGSAWLHVYPRGIRDLLLYVKNNYSNPRIVITENGVDQIDNSTNPLSLKDALNDTVRIQYYLQHLHFVQQAIEEKVRVEGFFAWSLIDNFEWASGYTARFGITYINYTTLARIPKRSAYWLRSFLKLNT